MLEADNKPLRNPFATSSLTALKPCRVLLAEQQQRKRPEPGRRMTKNQQLQLNDNSLKPEVKPSLVHCVLMYLHKNGFSKTLKRFLKEAQIENENWKACSFDLEDIYSRYVEDRCSRDADTNVRVHKEKDSTFKEGSGFLAAPEQTIGKKKKSKKSEKNNEDAVATYPEVENHAMVDSDSSSKKKKGKKTDLFYQSKQVTGDAVCHLKVDESLKVAKDKKNKKKSKLASESIDDHEKQTNFLARVIEKKPEASEVLNGDSQIKSKKIIKSKDKKEKLKLRTTFPTEDGQETKNRMATDIGAADISLEDCKAESKEKKRKKEVLVSKNLYDNGLEVPEERKSLEKSESGANKESKKRKLSASDDGENNPIEKIATGESKRRKMEGLEEGKIGEQQGKLNTVLEDDGHTGAEIKEENGVERYARPKSARQHWNGSAEPTKINAFQRVKVDEVKFVDDRLQDNSYWAKDGAEYGYGAKAQEVLGQVKGRDFRHEKTKKKRGSYRGGQIDFHSHSVKFNYSDDE